MESIPMWVTILIIAVVGGIFAYGLRIFLNNFTDSRPIVCDMCGKLARKTPGGHCPHCTHQL
ncbi:MULTISPECIES: hypothetical protein [unclassified Bacillus (in: firmicutes)]|uniref:hypothetical protein n=1 Tax=unclassified Bacillus (in: firmicutes) TaxID=185979 RepID=UPI0008E8631B|nr:MULTISPECIES: hypothetical protein [unclassified Bacillus (in: firmicutes)]SFA85751.1 hypothetical protein SAMN02799634_10256 [Bacillus sp. UNCCL13]SFQ83516.1 hypothetical protein SAMN04488577_2175 [Bacillus sp. cl95]